MTGPGSTPPTSAPPRTTPPTTTPLRYRPHRVIQVHVETLAIEDGHTPLPLVGDHTALVLGFREAAPDTPPHLVSTHRVWAEPRATSPVRESKDFSGRVTPLPPAWRTDLIGDGWAAVWHAPRAVVGEVELVGTITGDWSYGTRSTTLGRVLRVRRVTQTRHRTDPVRDDWVEDPDATVLTDLDPTETHVRFEHGRVPGDRVRNGPYFTLWAPDHVWTYDSGLLVEVDLDDTPTRALRPTLVPGGVAVHGSDVWVVDTRLPLLLRLRGGVVVGEMTWPGAVLALADAWEARGLHADATGCWVTGADGVHRVDLDGTVHMVHDGPARTSSATSAALLAVVVPAEGNQAQTLLVEADGTSRVVADAPRTLTPDRDGFIGFTGTRPPSLVRVRPDGSPQLGPALPDGWSAPRVHGDTPWVHSTPTLRPVRPDLTLGAEITVVLDGRTRGWWAWADRLWAVGAPPHGVDWRASPAGRPRTWLTEVDPGTGNTVSTAELPVGTLGSVAPDTAGAVWACGVGQLFRCLDGHVDEIDPAALLTEHRGTTTGYGR